ncbi:DUF2891 family protein [Luteococcus peritonei]|uniref:DUF2891 family protein n=1 Tax=Luteococcus peritonei TaxID=88874 RepID=A0ABW4RWL9_9ACTN
MTQAQPSSPPCPHPAIDREAEGWARTVVHGLRTRFPWASAHMSTGPDDCDVTPWRLHPAFHGCLDWHSSVHMQASGVLLMELCPQAVSQQTRDELTAELDARLTPEACGVEAQYLRAHPGFERPYGWGWATQLAVAVHRSGHPHAPAWEPAVMLVAQAAFDNLLAWLPKLTRPVRNGQHDNTAFGVALCLEAARELGRADVVVAVERAVLHWYGKDTDYPSRYEPGGNDFLSPALCEAALVQQVLRAEDFRAWLQRFLPELAEEGDVLLETPQVIDTTDGKLVHLYGLALVRAWMLRELAPVLVPPRRERALAAADQQADWAREQINHGDFMSTHWLVSFALRAELARQ